MRAGVAALALAVAVGGLSACDPSGSDSEEERGPGGGSSARADPPTPAEGFAEGDRLWDTWRHALPDDVPDRRPAWVRRQWARWSARALVPTESLGVDLSWT